MSEDASQAAATAAEGGADSGVGGNANPIFRTAAETASTSGAAAATVKPPGRQGAAQDRAGAPEQLLAEAMDAADDGQEPEPGSIEALKAELARVKAGEEKWRLHSREQEKRAKTNVEKAQKYDAFEESQKTEQQKLADQLAAAQAEARTAREDRFRLLAAAQYDLPPSLISHLGGGTEDEITERAEAFAQAINERAEVIAAAQAQAAAQQQPRNGNGGGFRPVESLRPGALPASDNKTSGDPNSWFRNMVAERKSR